MKKVKVKASSKLIAQSFRASLRATLSASRLGIILTILDSKRQYFFHRGADVKFNLLFPRKLPYGESSTSRHQAKPFATRITEINF